MYATREASRLTRDYAGNQEYFLPPSSGLTLSVNWAASLRSIVVNGHSGADTRVPFSGRIHPFAVEDGVLTSRSWAAGLVVLLDSDPVKVLIAASCSSRQRPQSSSLSLQLDHIAAIYTIVSC